MIRLVRYATLGSAAAVALQVLLPRVFSVILWYHLGFFAVSLAMLGFALGGLIERNRLARRRSAFDPAQLAAWASLSMSLALIVVVRLPIEPTLLLETVIDPALLCLAGCLLAVPFVLLGTLVCVCFEAGRERIGLLYGCSFFGGALGALLSLLAMEWIGTPRALGLVALIPLLGSLPSPRRGTQVAGLVLAIAALLVPDAILPLTSRKHFPKIAAEQVIDQQWNSFSRVTFYENPERHGLWQVDPRAADSLPESIGVAIDSWAITSILRRANAETRLSFLDLYPPTVAFHDAPQNFETLIIGAGGGVDVLAALHAGAAHVTAVEINPLIVDAVRGRFAEFSGQLYADHRVEVVVAEGRHFVDGDQHLYDRIVLSGVDTFAATEAGAFALSENYLYTVEALQKYYQHLKPGGVLALARWWFEPPRQTLRLTVTATQALAGLGITDLTDRVVIAHAGVNSLFLLKRGKFEELERKRLLQACQRRGAQPVHPASDGSGQPAFSLFSQALTLSGAEEVVRTHPFRVDATTDDRPFFFENKSFSGLFQGEGDWIHGRLGGQELLVATLLLLLLLSLPLICLTSSGSTKSGGGRRRVAGSLPFLLLGSAYLLVEVPLMQRLSLVLGHPIFAVAVVLVSLLIGSGIGSLVAARLERTSAPAAAFGAAVAVALVPIASHPALLQAVEGQSTVARCLATVAFLSLPAFLMGMPFPLAIRALGSRDALLVPTAFAANGIASVLAGPVAVLIAMTCGFRVVLGVGSGCYLLAAGVLWWVGREPQAA